jgi:hypothetical protein
MRVCEFCRRCGYPALRKSSHLPSSSRPCILHLFRPSPSPLHVLIPSRPRTSHGLALHVLLTSLHPHALTLPPLRPRALAPSHPRLSYHVLVPSTLIHLRISSPSYALKQRTVTLNFFLKKSFIFYYIRVPAEFSVTTIKAL